MLVAVQARALVEQWREGFRPFGAAPHRVALSWDMFAIEIERCGVSWSPPSYWQGRALGELREMGAAIEWDPIYNKRGDYLAAASLACGQRAPGQSKDGTFKIHCFLSHEKETLDEYACPSAP
jgi:hypothetical protein